MMWSINPFAFAMALAAPIALATAFLIWRQRSAPGASYLALAMVAAAEWAGALALEASASDISSKTFWSKAEYLGVSSSIALLLTFALAYSRNTHWLRFRRMALLWTAPALINLVVWTNDWHRQLWPTLTMSPGTNILLYGHGPAFYLVFAAHSVMFFLAAVLLIRAASNMASVYRLQVAVVALSCIPPWALAMIYAIDPALLGGMDMTAIGVLLTCVMLNWSLLRYRMLDLVPVARDAIIDGMSDGVLVLDSRDRILDLNPAAERLLGLSGTSPIGRNAADAMAAHSSLVTHLQGSPEGTAEILLEAGSPRYLDLRVSTLLDRLRRPTGRLVVLRDMTEVVMMREELRALSLVDELTGLHNRRGFLALAGQQLHLAFRLRTSACLLMADMDGLKLINDQFGHGEGDHALKEVARILRASCRESDVAARLGGDEFAVLAMGVPAGKVEVLTGRIAAAFQALNSTPGLSYRVSVSIGVALFDPAAPAGVEELLRAADARMYASKRGRFAGANLSVPLPVSGPGRWHDRLEGLGGEVGQES